MKDLKYKKFWLYTAIGMELLIIYLSLVRKLPPIVVGFDKKQDIAHWVALGGHFLAYFSIVFMSIQILKRESYLQIFYAFIFQGILFEFIQLLFLSDRSFQLEDIIANFSGCLLAYFFCSGFRDQYLFKVEKYYVSRTSA